MFEKMYDYYVAIEDTSRQMVEAARNEDWEQVVRFEGACAVLIEQLRSIAQTEQLQPDQRAEKTRIMQRILNNDAQIRYLAEPWLMQCEQNVDGQRQYLH